jgi:hypothetical protein
MRLFLKASLVTETLDLGDGLTLVGTQHSTVKEGINEWRLQGPGVDYGYLNVYFYSDIPFPSINTIVADPSGKGFGTKMVKAVINYYGGLTSDPQGNTSNAAVAMWEALGAKKIPTKRSVKGFYYQLEKK